MYKLEGFAFTLYLGVLRALFKVRLDVRTGNPQVIKTRKKGVKDLIEKAEVSGISRSRQRRSYMIVLSFHPTESSCRKTSYRKSG